jgi:hypothetical protein
VLLVLVLVVLLIHQRQSALTGGTQTVFWREGFNVLSGFEWRATPEDVIECGPSERIVINLPTGPGGSTPMNGIVVIEEG